jgi:nitric oxide reductase subunit B
MNPKRTFLAYLMNPKNWWLPFFLVLGISIAGVAFIGYETYEKAPPIPDFADEQGKAVLSHDQIWEGQRVFHHYALMEYGSMFGDGARRGAHGGLRQFVYRCFDVLLPLPRQA